MKNINNKTGYTLVELLVVIFLIGIVTAVAIPAFSGITDSAKYRTCGDYQHIIENTLNNKYFGMTEGQEFVVTKKDNDGKEISVMENNKIKTVYKTVSVLKPGTITIITGPTGEYFDCSMGTTGISKEVFASLFENGDIPHCPVANNCLKITISWKYKYSEDYDISISCYDINNVKTNHAFSSKE